MENVLFTRSSTPSDEPIVDGQLIFDTSGTGKMYLDNGTDRLEMGGAMNVDSTLSKTSTNPIQNKAVAGVMLENLTDIDTVTASGFLTDALATKELHTEVNEINSNLSNINVYVGEDDGKLHFVDSEGADSVLPFSNGNYYYRQFIGSDPVENRKDTLKVNTGVFFAFYDGVNIAETEGACSFCVKDGEVIVNRCTLNYVPNGNFQFSYSDGILSILNISRSYQCFGFYN